MPLFLRQSFKSIHHVEEEALLGLRSVLEVKFRSLSFKGHVFDVELIQVGVHIEPFVSE
jgi:hypothetical protein